MKSIYKIFFIGILAVIVSSCETIIDFDGDVQEPLLVLNSIIQSDSVITVKLSKSKFFLSKNPTFPLVENATVKAVINDSINETLIYTGKGVYKSTTVLKHNDKVEITADAPNIGIVKSATVVQPAITILSVDTIWEKSKDNNYYGGDIYSDSLHEVIGKRELGTMKIFVRFKDDSKMKNYYALNGKLVKLNYYTDANQQLQAYEQEYYPIFKYDDVIFGNTSNNQSGVLSTGGGIENNYFTDELINGKEYTLSFSLDICKETFFEGKKPKANRQDKYRLKIDFQQFSKDYYLYQQTALAAQFADPFFSEPVQIYNNIENGVGILGSISSSAQKIELNGYNPNYYYGYGYSGY